MRPLASLAASLAALVLAGCGSVGVTPIKPGPAKPKDHPIDIYTSEAEVKRPFEVCCLIDSTTGQGLFTNRSGADAIEKAKATARKQGADALIVMNTDTEGSSWTGGGRGKAQLKAIRYTK